MESSIQKQAAASSTMNAVLSKVTQIQEEIVEQEIEKYDTLLSKKNKSNDSCNIENNNSSNSDFMNQWRMKRLQEFELKQKEIQTCRTIDGHGMYQELGNQNSIDIAKEFFHVTKQSQRVIIHFYRPITELCNIFHHHLTHLAQNHIETRFLKCNVQDMEDGVTNIGKRGQNDNVGLRYLIERLNIRIMPTIICINNQKVVHVIEGCSGELHNRTDFTTNHLAYILGHKYQMLYPTNTELPDDTLNESNKSRITSSTSSYAIRHRYRNDDDDDEEEF
jgi:hypothetical protein